jgi:CMP-N-acetylneuraminic acid synthetase/spore coat polysaccharide biosynthesis predicted glycosyltransferase SpsG
MKINQQYPFLVVIPARSGSVGVPRKNLRSLNSLPLIAYSIRNALNSKFELDVYVSSNDDEILHIASKFGAMCHKRNEYLADGVTTLDPVIFEAYTNISKQNGKDYELIITLQPTSPLLRTQSLDDAIEKMSAETSIETMISATDTTHLTWRRDNGKFIPNYTKRVNRQQLDPTFTETGGFLITRKNVISENNRIGKNVELFVLPNDEAIDIDTYSDFNLCEYHLKRKRILFVVTGYNSIGFGHVYRTLLLASNITNHSPIFLFDKKSQEGYEIIKAQKFDTHIQQHDNILDDIRQINPDIVINDILDTSAEYVGVLKKMGLKVINFEDIGLGAMKADIVINALYEDHDQTAPAHFYCGYKYFCARHEFLLAPPKKITPEVKNILITFGGTDPSNFTYKVLDAVYDYTQRNDIELNVVLGLGYKQENTLSKFPNIKMYKNIKSMSDFMEKADIVFTGIGRTAHEAGSIGTPTIVIAQNEREFLHTFACKDNGYINMGYGSELSGEVLLETLMSLIQNYPKRLEMNRKMLSKNLKGGTTRVLDVINDVIDNKIENAKRFGTLRAAG